MRLLKNTGDFKSNLKRIFTGNYSREILTRVIAPLSIITYSVFIAFSWILYPNYDWTSMFISDLGVPAQNPIGWIVWSVGHVLVGIMLIPIISYLRPRLVSINKKWATIGTLFLYLAPIGAIGLGVIPQFPGEIIAVLHVINASLLMGGLYLGVWILAIILFNITQVQKKSIPIICSAFGAPIGFLTTQGIRLLIYPPESTIPFYLTFSTWEWILLYGIFFACILLIYIVPEKK